MTQENREQRRMIVMSAVEEFLNHIEEDFDNDLDYGEAQLGSVVICGEIYTTITEDGEETATTIPTFYCTNENAIWQRGFFEILSDYKRVRAEK